MFSRGGIGLLKGLLGVALAGTLVLQLLVLPWAAAGIAGENPEVADLRVPVLALSLAGVLCVQMVLVATWRLLGAVGASRIFDGGWERWVNLIVAALAGAGALAGVLLGIVLARGIGPVTVPAVALLGMVAGLGTALLMLVMRTLLRQATQMHNELEGVI